MHYLTSFQFPPIRPANPIFTKFHVAHHFATMSGDFFGSISSNNGSKSGYCSIHGTSQYCTHAPSSPKSQHPQHQGTKSRRMPRTRNATKDVDDTHLIGDVLANFPLHRRLHLILPRDLLGREPGEPKSKNQKTAIRVSSFWPSQKKTRAGMRRQKLLLEHGGGEAEAKAKAQKGDGARRRGGAGKTGRGERGDGGRGRARARNRARGRIRACGWAWALACPTFVLVRASISFEPSWTTGPLPSCRVPAGLGACASESATFLLLSPISAWEHVTVSPVQN